MQKIGLSRELLVATEDKTISRNKKDKPEDTTGVDVAHELSRSDADSLMRKVNRYIKHLRYGKLFSSYRPGFEVRACRLCQGVLMFHHFPLEAGVGQDCPVRFTDFVYREIRDISTDRQRGHPIASFVASVVQNGCVR